jgi:hypothetical protein
VYTTGGNRQFNIKATAETVERFYKMADEKCPRELLLTGPIEAPIEA